MTTNGDSTAWQRLAAMLIQRRTAIDPRFHSRGAFCKATGLKYRLVYDIEEAKRTNFGSGALASIEAAYQLEPGTIRDFLAGEEVSGLTPWLAAVPDAPAAEDATVHDIMLRVFTDPLERRVWESTKLTEDERLAVIDDLRATKARVLGGDTEREARGNALTGRIT